MEHQFSQATQRHQATEDDELERESGVLIGYVVSQILTKLSNALSAKQSSMEWCTITVHVYLTKLYMND